jgi:hypothetical protein
MLPAPGSGHPPPVGALVLLVDQQQRDDRE